MRTLQVTLQPQNVTVAADAERALFQGPFMVQVRTMVDVLASVLGFRGLPESALELVERDSEHLTLNAGDVLFKEGEIDDAIYLVASGTLEMAATLQDGRQQLLGRFGPSDCIGETVVLFNRPRQATVYAAVPSEVLKLSLPLLATLFDRHPSVYNELVRLAARRLSSFHLASSPVLAGIDIESLRMLDGDANWIRLAGGETLFRQGDPPDYLYVVVCGKLEVTKQRDDGGEDVIAHVSRGGCVGEMGLLTGERRSTTVRAARDTQLVRLSEEQFEMLLDRHPQCMRQIAKTFSSITRENGTAAAKARATTVAIVPAGRQGLPSGFMERLLKELSNTAGLAFDLSSSRIDYDLGQGSSALRDEAAHTRLINWLAEYEENFSYLLLECDPHLSAWTRLCIRHADLILIVGLAKDDPGVGEVETAIFTGALSTCSARKELVLVHSNTARMPSGTNDWLTPRRVDAHHHVRREYTPDYQRLARFIADKAVGLVLSGGGARGIAHIGAIQALEHCGVPIDFTGGTSIGAAVAGHWAMAADVPALTKIGRDFSNNFSQHFFRDLTLPVVSLNSARRFTKCLEHLFGDARIDLWIPYFCTSSNLSKAEVAVHDKGLLWTWIRASSSIPGIWPPVIRDGHMLVDGGVMNNLPVDVMRKRCRGPVIAVDVSPAAELRVQSGTHAELSGWPMLWKRLNPFGEKTKLPHLFGILYRAAQLGSICSSAAIKRKADLYLQPPTTEIDLFDWKSAHKLIDTAYQHCLNDIEQWKLRQ
jgi:CRP-like cAMP-binding protein/predicted acylesterase/phospholipase RssA